ncbi:hypothetical protein L4D06_08520 [Enterovibrio makurazakiensis]|uniref:hypothetical protein n=1 Tax=Enterovibrio makurazakiensis TaxID=2910232 RepID=UPI003D1A0347
MPIVITVLISHLSMSYIQLVVGTAVEGVSELPESEKIGYLVSKFLVSNNEMAHMKWAI